MYVQNRDITASKNVLKYLFPLLMEIFHFTPRLIDGYIINRTCIDMYSAPYDMGKFLKTELNLTHFYTKPKFLLAIWKYLVELFQKQLEVLKQRFFSWSYAAINICPLRTQYIFT